METHIEGTKFGVSLKALVYGESYRKCNVCRFLERVKCMETYIDRSVYGD